MSAAHRLPLVAAFSLACATSSETPNASGTYLPPSDDDDESSSGEATGSEESETGVPEPTVPTIPGFDLDVREGGWWKFSYVSDWSGGYPTNYETVFLLIVDAPMEVDGEEAFPVRLEILGVDDPEYAPTPTFGWEYLSFADHRIRGWSDGGWEPLFDAMTGVWPATSGGLFGHLRTSGFLDAMQIEGDWRVQASLDTTGCEVIPGYGEVCTDDPESYLGWYAFRPGIGPSGSYFQGCSDGCITDEFVLIDASPDGTKPLPEGCPVGDGLYCGGNGVGGDPDVLYECIGGELREYELCGITCVAAPPGSPDECEY